MSRSGLGQPGPFPFVHLVAPRAVEVRLPASHAQFGLEWHVEEGAVVRAGQLLAWLAVPDHCALVPLSSPADGRLTARWSALLASGDASALVALVEDDDPSACRLAERAALERAIARTHERIASFASRTSALAGLLASERTSLERWLAEAEARLRALTTG